MAERKYAGKYAESQAILYAQNNIHGANYRRITRQWLLNELPHEMQAILDEMDQYTSAKNKEPQRWVTEPGVNLRGEDGAPYTESGTWRLIGNRLGKPGKEVPGIYQDLARGYLMAPDMTGENLTDEDKTALWVETDKEARVLRYDEYLTDAAKNVMGIVNYYVIVYPNVAQEHFPAFCDAMEKRPDLDLKDQISQPRFYSGVITDGTYRFVKASNKPDEDGSSSDVIAVLCNVNAATNQDILMWANWNLFDYRKYYSGSPAIPAGLLPENVLAVDHDYQITYPPVVGAAQDTQSVHAKTYKVTGFNFDREDGLFKIEVTTQEAQPYWYIFEPPTGDGSTEYLIEFYHQTHKWVSDVMESISAQGLRVTLQPYLDEFKTFNGKIWGNTRQATASASWGYYVEDLTEINLERIGVGHMVRYVQTITYFDERKGIGVAAMKGTFKTTPIFTGPGGFFNELGSDWYKYRVVRFVFQRFSDNAQALIDEPVAPGPPPAPVVQVPTWNNWVVTFSNPRVSQLSPTLPLFRYTALPAP